MVTIKRCLLFVLSLGLLSTGLSVAYSDNTQAWAESTPTSQTQEDIVNYWSNSEMPGINKGDLANIDYVIYQQNSGSYDHQYFIGYTSTPSTSFGISDGGIGYTQFGTRGMCRGNKALTPNAGITCNDYLPLNSTYNYSANEIYYIHMTDETKQWYQDNAPQILERYSDIIGGGEQLDYNMNPYISMFYEVEDKKMRLVDTTQMPPHLSGVESEFACRLSIANENGTIVKDSLQGCGIYGGETILENLDYGLYYLKYEYLFDVNKDGVILPEGGTDEVGELNVQIKLDGTSFSGMVGSDWHEPKSDYADCSTYGTDIVAGFTCIMSNFGIFIKNLFIPKQGAIEAMFASSLQHAQVSLGYLLYPFEFMASIYNLFMDQALNPAGANCSIGEVPMFGVSGGQLELCAWRHEFPAYWSLLQMFAQAGLAIGVIFLWSRKLKQFIGGSSGEYASDETDSPDDTSGYQWFDDRTGDRGSIHDNSIRRR